MDLKNKLRELGEQNDYKGQGDTFLKETGVLLNIIKAIPQLSPRWAQDGKHGTCYSVIIAKLKEKPRDGEYMPPTVAENVHRVAKKVQFFFWNSIAEKEKGHGRGMGEKKPTAYTILAGLYTPVDSFEDFCGNFGYSTDSREAEKTYNEVRELNAKLESVFTAEELEALGEIA